MYYIIRFEQNSKPGNWYLAKDYSLESSMLNRKPLKKYQTLSGAKKAAQKQVNRLVDTTAVVYLVDYEIKDNDILSIRYVDTIEEAMQVAQSDMTSRYDIDIRERQAAIIKNFYAV